jgi:leucyl-tRNA---protein transferase
MKDRMKRIRPAWILLVLFIRGPISVIRVPLPLSVLIQSCLMHSLFTFETDPGPCGYLPDRDWSLHYEIVGELSPAEYQVRLEAGWRRFGYSLFRPKCPGCRMCLSLRIPTETFKSDRSQRRAAAANDGRVELVIGEPGATHEKLDLYDRFHRYQSDTKGWPVHAPSTPADYIESFVEHPFPTEEWCYYRDGRLTGVGYVDALPRGLSAIYFFYDPVVLDSSPGTYNVLSILREATRRRLPHVYLGYYVEGCRSLEYKARFRPNEVLGEKGEWRTFLD